MSAFEDAIKAFDAIEANLAKLEKLWESIIGDIPSGICFGIQDENIYDDKCRDFEAIAAALPAIDGWRIPIRLYGINAIAQMRFDAQEIDEVEAKFSVEEAIYEQGKHLNEYGYRARRKRRELIRGHLLEFVADVDDLARKISANHSDPRHEPNDKILDPEWKQMQERLS